MAHYDSEIELLYDNEGRSLVTYSYASRTGELTEGENIFENGVLAGIKWYSNPMRWEKFEYDEQGNTIKEIRGTGENIGLEEEITDYSNQFRDEKGRLVKIENYHVTNNATFELSYYQTWEYDGDELVRYSMYNSDGTLEWYHLYEDGIEYRYNGNGNLVKYVTYE